jgi:hypothetical protein
MIAWLAVRRAAAVLRHLRPHVAVGARKMNMELIESAVALAVRPLPVR